MSCSKGKKKWRIFRDLEAKHSIDHAWIKIFWQTLDQLQ